MLTAEELKVKLLSTDLFLDNEFLSKYVDFLINNSNNDVTDKTLYIEKHHIIPRSYFKIKKIKVDNSQDNIVRLTYLNHTIAHYYLYLCTDGLLKRAMLRAFGFLLDFRYELLTLPELEILELLTQYNELIISIKHLQQETCRQLGSKSRTVEHKLALKKARGLHSTTKGKKAIYNPELNVVKFVLPDELEYYLNNGWQLGSKPLSEISKQKIGRSNSIALRGKKHNNKSDDQIYSGLIGNKILCVETGQVFENIAAAKRWLQESVGIDGSQIKNCCSGTRDTTGGYHWQYFKEGD